MTLPFRSVDVLPQKHLPEIFSTKSPHPTHWYIEHLQNLIFTLTVVFFSDSVGEVKDSAKSGEHTMTVVPIRENLFTDKFRDRLGNKVEGYLKSPEEDRDRVVSEIEQVVCTSIVMTAQKIGTNLANSLLSKLFGDKPTSSSEKRESDTLFNRNGEKQE